MGVNGSTIIWEKNNKTLTNKILYVKIPVYQKQIEILVLLLYHKLMKKNLKKKNY